MAPRLCISHGAAIQFEAEVEEVNIELKYEPSGTIKEIVSGYVEVGRHGKLSIADMDGYKATVIVDKDNNPDQLRGVIMLILHPTMQIQLKKQRMHRESACYCFEIWSVYSQWRWALWCGKCGWMRIYSRKRKGLEKK